MLIELTQPHIFHTKEVATGTIVEVTKEMGKLLIDAGKAVAVSDEVEIVPVSDEVATTEDAAPKRARRAVRTPK